MKKLFVLLFSLLLFLPAFAQQGQGNWYTVLFPSAAQTATVTTPSQTNANWRGIQLSVNITAYTSGTWTPSIQGWDPSSSTWYDILVGPALAATGKTVLKVYPGILPTPNGSASDMLPRTWRVVMTGASTPIATFSVGGELAL